MATGTKEMFQLGKQFGKQYLTAVPGDRIQDALEVHATGVSDICNVRHCWASCNGS